MTAQEMLIKKFTSKLTSCWTTTLSWRKKIIIYIAEQIGTVHSYICIVAFHLDTIDESRERRDIGVKPEDGEWWTHPEDRRMDPDVHDRRKMFAEHLSSN